MRTKTALTFADAHKMMAAAKAEAGKQKWGVTIAVVDDHRGEHAPGVVAVAEQLLKLIHQQQEVVAIGQIAVVHPFDNR